MTPAVQHKMVIMSLAVPTELRAELAERAKTEDRSVSAQVRHELARYQELCRSTDGEQENDDGAA